MSEETIIGPGEPCHLCGEDYGQHEPLCPLRNTAQNTDRELWRKIPGDAFSPSIHVTTSGAIGINVGGHVIVAPVERWHEVMVRWGIGDGTSSREGAQKE